MNSSVQTGLNYKDWTAGLVWLWSFCSLETGLTNTNLPNFWQNTPVASLCFDIHPVDMAMSHDQGVLHDLETNISLATQVPEVNSYDRNQSLPSAQGFADRQYHDPQVPTPFQFALPEITVVNGMIILSLIASVKPGIKWTMWISQTNDQDKEYLSKIGKHSEEGRNYKYYN